MEFNELDVVELCVDFPGYGVKAGTIGTIVDVYSDGEYVVEITNEEGDTLEPKKSCSPLPWMSQALEISAQGGADEPTNRSPSG